MSKSHNCYFELGIGAQGNVILEEIHLISGYCGVWIALGAGCRKYFNKEKGLTTSMKYT